MNDASDVTYPKIQEYLSDIEIQNENAELNDLKSYIKTQQNQINKSYFNFNKCCLQKKIPKRKEQKLKSKFYLGLKNKLKLGLNLDNHSSKFMYKPYINISLINDIHKKNSVKNPYQMTKGKIKPFIIPLNSKKQMLLTSQFDNLKNAGNFVSKIHSKICGQSKYKHNMLLFSLKEQSNSNLLSKINQIPLNVKLKTLTNFNDKTKQNFQNSKNILLSILGNVHKQSEVKLKTSNNTSFESQGMKSNYNNLYNKRKGIQTSNMLFKSFRSSLTYTDFL